MSRRWFSWLAVGAALAVILLAVNVALTLRNLQQLKEDSAWVDHTYLVIRGLDHVLQLASDAETAERGFLITGEPRYLEPYDGTLAAVNAQVDELARLTADNPIQQVRFPALREHIAAKWQMLDETIALRKNGDVEAARTHVLTGRSKREMDAIRDVVGEMTRHEQSLLADRIQDNGPGFPRGNRGGASFRPRRGRSPGSVSPAAAFASDGQDPGGVCHFRASGAAADYLGQHRRRGHRHRHVRPRHDDERGRRGAHRLAARRCRGPTARRRLSHRQRGNAANRREPGGEGVARGSHRRAGKSHGAHQPQRLGNSDRRQRRPDPLQGRGGGRLCTGFPRHLRAKTLRSGPARKRRAAANGPASLQDRNLRVEHRDGGQSLDARIGVDVRAASGRLFGDASGVGSVGPSARSAASRPAIARALALGEYTDEWRVVWPDGSIHWLAGRGRLFKDSEGRPRRLIGINIDITDRKRVEDELRRLAAELSEADRRKDEFLATLAHELRNPLAPIANGLQIMRLKSGAETDAGQSVADQSIADARAMMERQLGHMIHLVDDLLDASRISQGKLELRKERAELTAILNHAVETSRPVIEAAGHELTVSLPREPVFVDADVTRLAQVFANLLNNAAKYSEPPGHIWLAADRQGSDAVVSVKDAGVGIPPEMLSRIFELFTQVDQSLERSQGGLGIGLTLVRRLVDMHGGSVEARSEGRGKGSEFVVRLPIMLPAQGGSPLDTPAPASPFVRRRILVADDNFDSANSLGMLLKIMGHEVHLAGDGEQAVEMAAALEPDVIVLDIGMPKLNGYEACLRIQKLPWASQATFIALTGWGQDEDKRRSQEAGFHHHLIKPVDPAALQSLLGGLPAAVE